MQQFRHAARAIVRAPAFALTTIATLALGIGLSTAVFTIANALLRRGLPVGGEDRLIVLWGETSDVGFSNYPLDLEDVRAFAARARSLEQVAVFAFRGATATTVRIDERVLPVRAALVSGNWFDVLQSPPALGRALRATDDVAGAAPVLVLSHRAWTDQFAGDSAIIGRSVELLEAGRTYTVIGVLPEGLDYPRGTDAWLPLTAHAAAGGFLDRATGELDILARMRQGSTLAQARTELTAWFASADAPAAYGDVRGAAYPLRNVVLGDTRPALLIFSLAAALLLFITCVNVANLLLVRALRRTRELVVRAALGASRRRIAAQLLSESILLSAGGGLLGFAFAVVAIGGFRRLAPPGTSGIDAIGIDASAMIAAVLVTAIAVVVSGVGPAMFAAGVHAHDALRSGTRHSAGRGIRRVAEVLVVAQVALAAVSLSAAGLITRSLIGLVHVDLAFEPSRLLAAGLVLQPDRFEDPQQAAAQIERLLPVVEAVPGVESATPVLAVPFIGGGGGIDGRITTPEQDGREAAGSPMLNMEVVAPDYFATLGIPVLRGRPFSDGDREGAVPVAIVSRSIARHFWADGDPIGRRVRGGGGEWTVVGVVPDTRYRELHTLRPTIYFPLRQSHFPVVPTTLLVRTSRASLDIVPTLRRTIDAAGAGITMGTLTGVESLLNGPRAQTRLNTVVLALFATAAVALAGIGLFAVVATMVGQRRHEIGIRMALGATAVDVRRMVMLRGLGMAALGSALGIAGTLTLGRLLSALLFDIRPTDVPTLLGVTALMLAVAAAATFLPARSTRRIDPIVALRADA